MALDAIREMHEHDVVHLDLNCGNLLIAPDFQSVAIIDFEFAPLLLMSRFDQQRFDYLRLAHNLLKPRAVRRLRFCNLNASSKYLLDTSRKLVSGFRMQ